ncbi:restriction endonuclease subunit S [Aeromonas rivipollensis]|uniref:restriction endonuclease subunit S n=1 Tax=Aeromonas rivipollensis TaxID=948519 RepID=UPI0038D1039B
MVRDQLPIVKLGKLLPQPYKNGIYKSADFYGDGTQILRITDFDNEGHLVTDELQCLHLENNEVENYKLTSRDIVINRVNSLTHIGKSILWLNNTDCTTVYESNMMRIQPDESAILPEYLIRILQSEPAREHFRKVAKRAVAQCSINQQDVKSLSFPLHPLPEQKKIAQILSTWDRAISSTEQLLANSQQQKKALMQQLLTGKKRLLDNNGVRFSGEWKAQRIGSLLKEVKRPVQWDDDSEYHLLSVKRRSEGVVLREILKGSDILTKKMNTALAGDFLISKMQVVHGATGLVTEEFNKCHISDSYIALRPKDDEKIDIAFFSWFSKQKIMYHKAFLCSYGVHIEKMTFNFNMFVKEKVVIPATLEEQQKIAAVLSTADQEITTLQQKLDALKQEKKALMQQLLTGKLRVQEPKEEVAC